MKINMTHLRQLEAESIHIIREVAAEVEKVPLPSGLCGRVKSILDESPELPWDEAIWRLAALNGDGDTGRRGSQDRSSSQNADKRGGQA